MIVLNFKRYPTLIFVFKYSHLFLRHFKFMNDLFKSSLGRLRIIAFLEGCSLLLLVFVAMPIKYLLNIPEATQAIGLIHGILFIVFVVATLVISILHKWNLGRVCMVMASSVLPFGTFYIDRKILSKLTK
jgi:integral membrane protein